MKNIAAYAAWNNNDEIRMKSSSGGIFSAFAQKVFDSSGIVYGVVESKNGLYFDIADNMDDIQAMRGSKYYQADTSSIDIELLYSNIASERPILIVGTSCQIGMFHSIIEAKFHKVPQNVYLVDIICHGVASRKYLDVYIRELEKKYGSIVRHSFRNKTPGKVGSQVSEYVYESGKIKKVDNENDYFMRFFSPGFFLRPSCYKCRYAGGEKLSDISIGDFNGAGRVVKEFPDDTHCVSAIITNTSKGENFLAECQKTELLTLIETSYEVIASQNLPLLHPEKKTVQRDIVFDLIDKLGFINTCRLLGGKYYLRCIICRLGGKRLLNKIKKCLGRTIIEN